VCSDPTVSRQSDEIWIEPTEIDFRVDTDPEIVKRFWRLRERVKVVFSTYQSSPVVGQAMGDVKPFDVAIFDEAHKTTGPAATTFAAALSDSRVPIRKRLFFTAPRHLQHQPA
jgi:predicted helicase